MTAKKTEATEHAVAHSAYSPGLIYPQMVKVMSDIGSIGKNQTNQFDKYKFRGIDDLYNALYPVFCKHEVFVVPSVRSCRQSVMKTTKGSEMQTALVDVEYHFYAADGSCVVAAAPGEGADRGDKAVNKAMSGAFKTVLLQTFCIPTEEQADSEHESPDLSGARPAAPVDLSGENPANYAAEPELDGDFFFKHGASQPVNPAGDWLDAKISSGKMAGKTWGDLMLGSFKGQRYHFLAALTTFECDAEKEKKFATTRERAARALWEIERKERLRRAGGSSEVRIEDVPF